MSRNTFSNPLSSKQSKGLQKTSDYPRSVAIHQAIPRILRACFDRPRRVLGGRSAICISGSSGEVIIQLIDVDLTEDEIDNLTRLISNVFREWKVPPFGAIESMDISGKVNATNVGGGVFKTTVEVIFTDVWGLYAQEDQVLNATYCSEGQLQGLAGALVHLGFRVYRQFSKRYMVNSHGLLEYSWIGFKGAFPESASTGVRPTEFAQREKEFPQPAKRPRSDDTEENWDDDVQEVKV